MSDMLVETFEQHVERHPEACDEAARLIAELGLSGQQSLGGETTERCPYRQWTAVEMEVYSLLCQSVDKVEDYDADTIPLRVLQVLAHAKSLGIYEAFEVRHAASPSVKDPVLLGVPTGQSWLNEKRHLLARWGAELDEFPAMERVASKLKLAQLRDGVDEKIAELEAIKRRIESAATSGLSLIGKSVPTVYATGW